MHNDALEMNKYTIAERRTALREVLSGEPIGDQDRLRAALRKRGFRTTQATISRDLREMGVVKTPVGPGAFAYRLPSASLEASPAAVANRLRSLFREFVVDVKGASNLIVIKTRPGDANAVASLIDASAKPGVLGTVAGDDTILVVVNNEKRRAEAEREFRALLQGA